MSWRYHRPIQKFRPRVLPGARRGAQREAMSTPPRRRVFSLEMHNVTQERWQFHGYILGFPWCLFSGRWRFRPLRGACCYFVVPKIYRLNLSNVLINIIYKVCVRSYGWMRRSCTWASAFILCVFINDKKSEFAHISIIWSPNQKVFPHHFPNQTNHIFHQKIH